MSLYLEMWDKAKKMSKEELKAKFDELSPPTGNYADFFGLKVIDIDLFECISFLHNLMSLTKCCLLVDKTI